MNKNTLFILAGVLIVIILLIVFIRGGSDKKDGNVYVAIKNSIPTNATDGLLSLTISEIEVWNDQEGWERVSDRTNTISLSDPSLTTDWTVIAQTKLPSGTYDRIRFTIDEVVHELSESTSTRALVLAEHLSLDGTIVISDDQKTTITLALQEDLSRYHANDGRLVFIPSVVYETRHGGVITELDDTRIRIDGGTVHISQTFGMDETGDTRANFRLPQTAKIEERGGGILIDAPIVVDPATLLPQKELQDIVVSDSITLEGIASSTEEEVEENESADTIGDEESTIRNDDELETTL